MKGSITSPANAFFVVFFRETTTYMILKPTTPCLITASTLLQHHMYFVLPVNSVAKLKQGSKPVSAVCSRLSVNITLTSLSLIHGSIRMWLCSVRIVARWHCSRTVEPLQERPVNIGMHQSVHASIWRRMRACRVTHLKSLQKLSLSTRQQQNVYVGWALYRLAAIPQRCYGSLATETRHNRKSCLP